MVSKMVYPSIVPNPVGFIPNVDVTMTALEAVALQDNAGANVDPLNYNAQLASVYYDDLAKQKLKKEEVTTRKSKRAKPKMNIKSKSKVINGINTKIKPLIPRSSKPTFDFILGKKEKNNTIIMGMDLNKINDSFKTPKISMKVVGIKKRKIKVS